MDNISSVVSLWGDEAVIILAILAGCVLAHYVASFWRMPGNVTFTVFLGITLGVVIGLYFFLLPHIPPGVHRRIMLFLMLYGWCALGTVFFAARSTHPAKLGIGLVIQAVIFYALFHYF